MKTLADGTLECSLADTPYLLQSMLESLFVSRCACCTLDEIFLRQAPGERCKLTTQCGIVLELGWDFI